MKGRIPRPVARNKADTRDAGEKAVLGVLSVSLLNIIKRQTNLKQG